MLHGYSDVISWFSITHALNFKTVTVAASSDSMMTSSPVVNSGKISTTAALIVDTGEEKTSKVAITGESVLY